MEQEQNKKIKELRNKDKRLIAFRASVDETDTSVSRTSKATSWNSTDLIEQHQSEGPSGNWVDLDLGTDVDQGYCKSEIVSQQRLASNSAIKIDLSNHSANNFKEHALEMVHFILFCMGFGVGLGNLWRFPYLAYRNAGGSFILAYTVLVAIVGIPLFFLELALGQFSGQGPVGCWSFCPILHGIGIAMVALSFLVAIPYSMTIAIAIHYLISSFTFDLPWLTCDDSWASPSCRGREHAGQESFLNESCNEKELRSGSCSPAESLHQRLERVYNGEKIIAAEEYFYRAVIAHKYGSDLTALTNSMLVGCYLGGWLLVGIVISLGLKLISKIMYVTALLPYMSLVTFLIACLNLPGAMDGVKEFFTPDIVMLQERDLWLDAAVQVFYSLTVTFGGLISLASMNDFHSNCLKNTFILTFINFTTSLLAGLAVFSCVGVFVAEGHLDSMDEVGNFGPELIFIVYPSALQYLPAETFWSLLLFATLVIVGLNNQLILLTTVTTAISEALPSHPKLKLFKMFIPALICIFCCLLGVPLITEKHVQLYEVLDTYTASSNALLIGLGGCIALTWIYGAEKFMTNIITMIGRNSYFFVPWWLWKLWWKLCWRIIIPLTMLTFVVIDFLRPNYQTGLIWQERLIWVLKATTLLIVTVSIVIYLIRAGGTFKERLFNGFRASSTFGPWLASHRASVMVQNEAHSFFDLHNSLVPVQPVSTASTINGSTTTSESDSTV